MKTLSTDSGSALRSMSLTKKYGTVTALENCTIEIPHGALCALVGPNGAGKTTLLRCLAGLSRPTSGQVEVLDHVPGQDVAFLADISFLAQEIPLWKRMSPAEHITIGSKLNPRWDARTARERLHRLDIPTDRPVRTLSGGQRAQVALTLALAKRPRLLLLDEPVAALDPLARRHFLGILAEAVAEEGLTVLISSHLISDLERVCDHLVLLAASNTQLCASTEEILNTHRMLIGLRDEHTSLPSGMQVIDQTNVGRQTSMLVRTEGPIFDPSWEVAEVSLEEIVLAYMSHGGPQTLRALYEVGGEK